MAKEDKSVRQLVQNIDKRTSDLAPVLDNLSESLNKITKAFSPRKEENDSPKKDKRAALLEKFAPKVDPTEQLIEETDQNELVLREIKEAIEKNHKESFKVFQNMENFLKVIAVEGAAGGGGVGGLLEGLDIGGKDKGGKPGKSPVGAAKAGGGFLKNAARFASKAALPLAAGMAAFDAVGGYQKASENLGIEGREATFGEKLSSGAGSAISGLTFGLLDEKAAGKGIASFFGAGPPKTPEEAANQSEMLDLAAQAEGGIPTETKEEIKDIAPEKAKQLIQPTPVTPPAAPRVEAKPTPVTPPAAPRVEAKPTPVTPPAASVATTVTPTTKVDKKAPGLPDGVTQDPNSGVYIYKDIMFPAQSKDEIKYNVQAIDTEKEVTFDATDRNAGPVTKTIKVSNGQIEVVSMKPKGSNKELSPSTPNPKVQEAEAKAEAVRKERRGLRDKISKGTATEEEKAKFDELGKQQIEAEEGLVKARAGAAEKLSLKQVGLNAFAVLDEKGEKIAMGRSKEDAIEQVKKVGVSEEALKSLQTGPSAEAVTPSTQPSATVSSLSQENADMKAEGGAVQPVIITNNNSTSSNQQTVSPIRTSPRPSNNSFERKQNQVSSY